MTLVTMQTDSPDGDRTRVRFTEWAERTPTSFRFWEVFLTPDQVVLCFVGESYKSALLKADMGAGRRRDLDGLSVEELAREDEHNRVVPRSDLRSIRYAPGSIVKRASLELEYEYEGDVERLTLYKVKDADSQAETARALANDDGWDDVDIEVADGGLLSWPW